jgi:hypothetical protein
MARLDKKTISEVMREMGRKGGKKGGKRRMETMTPEERQEIARKAGVEGAKARWGDRKKAAGANAKRIEPAKGKKAKRPSSTKNEVRMIGEH